MLVLLSVLIFWNIFLAFAQRCTPPEGVPNCVCETAQGTIDLRPLYNEGSPKFVCKIFICNFCYINSRFKDVLDSTGQAYLFNPCIGISGDEQCGGQTSAVRKVTALHIACSDLMYKIKSSITFHFCLSPHP